ncbi:hypothetical protein T484DRAFT_2027810 [Baffinella frigidus]|nr:hypothetical protein T484DRAFT_2027810 [Cryptophyta sp. CCMP2293]
MAVLADVFARSAARSSVRGSEGAAGDQSGDGPGWALWHRGGQAGGVMHPALLTRTPARMCIPLTTAEAPTATSSTESGASTREEGYDVLFVAPTNTTRHLDAIPEHVEEELLFDMLARMTPSVDSTYSAMSTTVNTPASLSASTSPTSSDQHRRDAACTADTSLPRTREDAGLSADVLATALTKFMHGLCHTA